MSQEQKKAKLKYADRRIRRKKKKEQKQEKAYRVSKTILIFVVLLAFAIVPAIFLNTMFGYLPALVVVLWFVGSKLYVTVLAKALVFEENSDFDNCVRGAGSAFSINIHNRSPFVYTSLEIFFYISDLFGGEDDVTSTVITLMPFEKRQFHFDVEFAHIGTYEVGLHKVVMSDLFGFFYKTVKNESRYQVQVAPKVFDLAKLHVSNQTFSESKNMLIPNRLEGSDYQGVREYVMGDPIKLIHWKLSVRAGHYMTRVYESYGNAGISIIMDFESEVYDRESLMSVFDGIVETALSAEVYAKRNGMDVDILYYNKDGRRKKYMTRQESKPFELISDLPKVTTEKRKTSAIEILRQEGSSSYSQGNLAFITAKITPALIRLMQDIKMRKKHPILFLVIPNCLYGEERRKYLHPLRSLDYARIPYYVLGDAEELQKGGGRRVS